MSPACSPAKSQVVTLINPQVIPGIIDGRHAECDISFHLARGYTGRDFASAIGATLSLYATSETQWAGALKIGYQPAPGTVLPPQDAYLVTSTGDNESEVYRQSAPDAHGYIIVTFSGGQRTSEAFDILADRGAALIRLRMPNREAEDWTLDLRPRQDVRDAWSRCLEEIDLRG